MISTIGRRTFVLLMIMSATLWGSGCGSQSQPDGGEEDGDGGFNTCQIDNSQRGGTDPAWELKSGGTGLGSMICPRRDIDYFWFKVDKPGTIARVSLSTAVPRSRVDLCYRIVLNPEAGPAVGELCDNDGEDGVTRLVGTHYLRTSGTYFLDVSDANGDDEDSRAPYQIAIELVPDPDTYEENNKSTDAKVPGSAKGYISSLGDEDWFKIDVPDGSQLITIDLGNDALSPVDLHYAVFRPDGTSEVNAGEDANGMDAATVLHDVLALPEAGTYFVQITDAQSNESDLTVGYTLKMSLRTNPDKRDLAPGNNSVDHATPLSSGAAIADAFLASRADEDWYVIQSPGTTSTNPALLEIDLVIASASPVDPAIDLIVADSKTPCSAGDPCGVLTSNCGDCDSIECRDARCPSHECLPNEPPEGKCGGAGVCLPGGCGIRSLVMHGVDWSETGDQRHLHTVAPMFGATYYLLVRDFQGDDFDTDNSYKLTATVRPERDTNESPPNGLYLPYATNEQEDDTKRWNGKLATPISCSDGGGGITCGPLVGYLSFRGDQDWYVLEGFPAEDKPAVDPPEKDTKVDYGLAFQWSFNGKNDLSINYALYLGDTNGNPQTGWVHDGKGSGTHQTADGECVYLCGESQGSRPLYFSVQHKDRKKYDYDNPYTVTLTAKRECPAACEYCKADCKNYPCPNPLNPNPENW